MRPSDLRLTIGIVHAAILLAPAAGWSQQPAGPLDARGAQGPAKRQAAEIRVEVRRAEPAPLAGTAIPRRINNLSEQLRPFYRYELMQIRSTCGLTPEQFRAIRPRSDAAYEAAVLRQYHGEPSNARVRLARLDVDYASAIHEAVESVFKPEVSPEKWKLFEEDQKRRQARRRDAGAELLVAMLDRDLQLTGDQRRQLIAAVAARWEDRWCDGLTVGYTVRSLIPDLPDELVTPYLSETQRGRYKGIQRYASRLLGVTIDHGKSLLAADELGGAGARIVRVNTPRLPLTPDGRVGGGQVVMRGDIQQVPVQVAEVRVAAARPIALAGVAIPPPRGAPEEREELDEKVAEIQRRNRERALRMARLEAFETYWTRARVPGPHDDAQSAMEAALSRHMDHLKRACGLDEAAERKLRTAGRGDIKRFLDKVADERRRLEMIDDLRTLVTEISRARVALQPDYTALMAPEGPILTKATRQTLSVEQQARLEQDLRDRAVFRHRAAVRWTTLLLARSLGLTDDKCQQLEARLLEHTLPPVRSGISDYVIVMYQASVIPAAELRPIFDEFQWSVLAAELSSWERFGPRLRGGGYLADDMIR